MAFLIVSLTFFRKRARPQGKNDHFLLGTPLGYLYGKIMRPANDIQMFHKSYLDSALPKLFCLDTPSANIFFILRLLFIEASWNYYFTYNKDVSEMKKRFKEKPPRP